MPAPRASGHPRTRRGFEAGSASVPSRAVNRPVLHDPLMRRLFPLPVPPPVGETVALLVSGARGIPISRRRLEEGPQDLSDKRGTRRREIRFPPEDVGLQRFFSPSTERSLPPQRTSPECRSCQSGDCKLPGSMRWKSQRLDRGCPDGRTRRGPSPARSPHGEFPLPECCRRVRPSGGLPGRDAETVAPDLPLWHLGRSREIYLSPTHSEDLRFR